VNGATYERTSFMRGLMYGSTEKYAFRTRAGLARLGDRRLGDLEQLLAGKPCGRATRRISRDTPSMVR
jgi:hypothetical protein